MALTFLPGKLLIFLPRLTCGSHQVENMSEVDRSRELEPKLPDGCRGRFSENIFRRMQVPHGRALSACRIDSLTTAPCASIARLTADPLHTEVHHPPTTRLPPQRGQAQLAPLATPCALRERCTTAQPQPFAMFSSATCVPPVACTMPCYTQQAVGPEHQETKAGEIPAPAGEPGLTHVCSSATCVPPVACTTPCYTQQAVDPEHRETKAGEIPAPAGEPGLTHVTANRPAGPVVRQGFAAAASVPTRRCKVCAACCVHHIAFDGRGERRSRPRLAHLSSHVTAVRRLQHSVRSNC